MDPGNLEDIVQQFADTDDKITTRQEVVDGGANKAAWIPAGTKGTEQNAVVGSGADGGWMWKIFAATDTLPYDSFPENHFVYLMSYPDQIITTTTTTTGGGGYYGDIPYTYTGTTSTLDKRGNYYLFIGYHPNTTFFNDVEDAWQKFSTGPVTILQKAATYDGNDQVSSGSFDYASNAVSGLINFLGDWAAAFEHWSSEFNSKDGSFQGSAAAVFQWEINTFSEQMRVIQNKLEDSKTKDNLADAGKAVSSAATGLLAAVQDYMNETFNSPAYAVQSVWIDQVFQPLLGATWTLPSWEDFKASGFTKAPVPNVTLPWGGDASSQVFWDGLEAEAKKEWLNDLGALDNDMALWMPALDSAYKDAIASFPVSFPSPLSPPPSSSSTSSTTGGPNDDPSAQIAQAQKDANDAILAAQAANAAALAEAKKEADDQIKQAQDEAKQAEKDAQDAADQANARAGADSKKAADDAKAASDAANQAADDANARANAAIKQAQDQASQQASDTQAQADAANTENQKQMLAAQQANQAALDSAQAENQKQLTAAQQQVQTSVTGGDPTGSAVREAMKSLDPNAATVDTNGQLVVPVGSTVTSSGDVLGPNGQLITGANGQPITVPKGSVVNPDGSVTTANGQPVEAGTRTTTSADARATQLTPHQVVSTASTITSPTGQVVTDAGGHTITVPNGSTVNANGTITGPNGQILTGANGKPITVPSGSTISSPLSLAGGPTIPAQSFRQSPLNPVGSAISDSASSLAGAGGGGFGGGGSSGGLGGSGLNGVPLKTARASSTTQVAAEKAASTANDLGTAEVAAEEGQLMSRVATTGGGTSTAGEGPMMPPMSGGGGGGGGSQQGGRKTWVTEDEDVWGTESETTSGVLGR